MAGYPPSEGYMPSSDSYISSNSQPTTSKGFEYIQSDDRDDRLEMEANIDKITNAVLLSRGKLAFSNDDLIEQNAINVGPQHNLETFIHQKLELVQNEIRESSEDIIPQSVFEKLTRVVSIAKEGNASTFTASAALDTVLEAFSYGRTAAKNRFNLKRESKRCLQQYDETFLSMVQSQIDVDLDKADTEKHNCLHLLGEAVKESRTDNNELLERQDEESQLVDLPKLEAIHSTSTEELQSEEVEYAEIGEKCKKDIKSIDDSLQELNDILSSTIGIHQNREEERSKKLEVNRTSQDDLRERLKQLEAEEREYLRVAREEEEMMETAQNDYSRAEADLIELKEKISILEKQATASLRILEVMKGCTDEILVDAKKRKTDWQEKLKGLEVESLLNTRDVLIATICLHKMEADDCSRNFEDSKKQMAKMKLEMQEAAQRMFKERVKELQGSMAKYDETKQSYCEKLEKHNSKIQEMSDELASVTGRIKSLDSGMSLPNIDTIYRERCHMKEDCFKKASVEDARNKLHSCLH